MSNCFNNVGYLNRKFTDIFPQESDFSTAYSQSPLGGKISAENQAILYYLLYAKYGNSTIASSDENQFKYKVFSIIFQYGPTWEKELEIQNWVKTVELDSDALAVGTTKIYNSAQNPDVTPSDQTLKELQYISQQNVSKTKRGKVEQYALVLDLLKRDVSEYFLAKFKPLFLTVVAKNQPDCYCCETVIDGKTYDCGCEV